MGGWKASGLGTRHGEGGIRKYCRQHQVGVRVCAGYPMFDADRAGIAAKHQPAVLGNLACQYVQLRPERRFESAGELALAKAGNRLGDEDATGLQDTPHLAHEPARSNRWSRVLQ